MKPQFIKHVLLVGVKMSFISLKDCVLESNKANKCLFVRTVWKDQLSLNSLFAKVMEISFGRCSQNVKKLLNDLQFFAKFDPLIFDQDSFG
jgi:hypothetical protein